MNVNYWMIIPAAGLGLRMGASVPKKYLKLHGKTIFEHTLAVAVAHPKIKRVVVALNAEDPYWPSIEKPDPSKLLVVTGGETRQHSVLEGLKALETLANKQDWVLVHDAVRPCLQVSDIEHLIQTVGHHSVGGILGIPVQDTLKSINADRDICHTVPRENIWHAQTPQMFRFEILYQALSEAVAKNIATTDDASAVELLGLKPLMVQGDARNIKITYPSDLVLAEQLLKL